MKAKDLMVPLQEYLTPEHTLKEAANLLRIARRGEEKIGVKALPVLDRNLKLIGILSIGDILKAVYPKYMLKHNVKRVPVINRENKVTGMLYERDIFYFITDAMQNDTGV